MEQHYNDFNEFMLNIPMEIDSIVIPNIMKIKDLASNFGYLEIRSLAFDIYKELNKVL
jgi:hypothetical protein